MHEPRCKAAVRLRAASGRTGRRPWLRRVAALAVASVISASMLTTGAAWAQSADVTGTVVALDQGTALVVDLGASKGATVGGELELWRPFKLKHPVTGRVLTDRFQIGTLRFTQVGPTLSLAIPASALNRPAEAGDVVILRGASATPAPSPASTEPAPKPTASSSSPPAAPTGGGPVTEASPPEAKVLSELFDGLQGASLVKRIRAYEDYVRASPQGRYARVLYEEAQALRQLLFPPAAAAQQPAAQMPPQAPEATLEVLHFQKPESALSDTPLVFGIELKGPASGALLHIRRSGARAYSTWPMRSEGPGYFRVLVPPGEMRAPSVDYFIEGVKRDGTAVLLVGTPPEPVKLEVAALPSPEGPKKHAYTASLWTDYASYNSRKRNDYAWQTEGYFGMRFGDTGVRALRSGFGVYRGAGGSIRELDELDKEPRAIGLTYGYLETEIGVSQFFSLLGRGVVGLRDSGVSGGAQAMVRIGNDRRTNMQLGGEVLGGVGLRGIAQLELNTFEKVPVLLRTEVTNQPAGVRASSPRPVDDDVPEKDTSGAKAGVGVRGILQAGYRVTSSLTVSARVSYQGRTIFHSGPGAGAGLSYDW